MLSNYTKIAPVVAQQARRFGAQACVSRWGHVQMGPKDPILGVSEAFKADPNPNKINLGVGAYRDDDCKPVVLPSVKEAQNRINDANMDNEYAPIVGILRFVDLSLELAYGKDCPALVNKEIGDFRPYLELDPSDFWPPSSSS